MSTNFWIYSFPRCCRTALHTIIKWASLSFTCMFLAAHQGHFFHCLPSLFFILLPSSIFPVLVLFKILLNHESLMWYWCLNHGLACGMHCIEPYSTFFYNTNRTAASITLACNCFFVIVATDELIAFSIPDKLRTHGFSWSCLKISWRLPCKRLSFLLMLTVKYVYLYYF